METDNLPSFVYINHYEFFTSENLKAFENGQPFHFKYHKEVQQFYDCRQTKIFPSSQRRTTSSNSMGSVCSSLLSKEPSTYSTKSSSQSSIRSANSLNSHASSVHSSQNSANSQQQKSKTYTHHFNVKPLPKIRHTTLSSNESTKISSRPASFISQNSNNNNLTPKLPPPYASLHLIPNSTAFSIAPRPRSSTNHSSHNSTKSSTNHSSHNSTKSSIPILSAKTSTASISLNSSFDSSHGSIKQNSKTIENKDLKCQSSQDEPKVIVQSSKQLDGFPNKTEQFLAEIRNFKLRPVEKQQPLQKVPIFKLNSNPLLTSEHLHKQIDLVRQRLNESTENSDNESQGQWSLI